LDDYLNKRTKKKRLLFAEKQVEKELKERWESRDLISITP
jgi:hypothetical protein